MNPAPPVTIQVLEVMFAAKLSRPRRRAPIPGPDGARKTA